ncbi:hypothetical protein C2W63_02430 [Bacillus velezensis]|nr:hypothetical protein C2W63_02430 [Bacillus velezensis]RUR98038.1 hypothetical protein EFW57_02412 [Bacillus velezensis]
MRGALFSCESEISERSINIGRKRKWLPCKSVSSAVRDIQTTVLESQGIALFKGF